MEQDHSDNRLIIERYLRGELSASEVAAFEEEFLSSDEMLDQLESAEQLGQGLADIAALREPSRAGAAQSRMPAIFHSPSYAMAASVFLLVSLGITGVLYQRVNELDTLMGGAGASPAQIVPLVSVRSSPGSEPVNVIHLDQESPLYVLMLDPGFERYRQYRATVVDADGGAEQTIILQTDNLTPGYEDMLALSVPAALLKPGQYEIRLEGRRDEAGPDHEFDPVSVLTLRVRPSE